MSPSRTPRTKPNRLPEKWRRLLKSGAGLCARATSLVFFQFHKHFFPAASKQIPGDSQTQLPGLRHGARGFRAHDNAGIRQPENRTQLQHG